MGYNKNLLDEVKSVLEGLDEILLSVFLEKLGIIKALPTEFSQYGLETPSIWIDNSNSYLILNIKSVKVYFLPYKRKDNLNKLTNILDSIPYPCKNKSFVIFISKGVVFTHGFLFHTTQKIPKKIKQTIASMSRSDIQFSSTSLEMLKRLKLLEESLLDTNWGIIKYAIPFIPSITFGLRNKALNFCLGSTLLKKVLKTFSIILTFFFFSAVTLYPMQLSKIFSFNLFNVLAKNPSLMTLSILMIIYLYHCTFGMTVSLLAEKLSFILYKKTILSYPKTKSHWSSKLVRDQFFLKRNEWDKYLSIKRKAGNFYNYLLSAVFTPVFVSFLKTPIKSLEIPKISIVVTFGLFYILLFYQLNFSARTIRQLVLYRKAYIFICRLFEKQFERNT